MDEERGAADPFPLRAHMALCLLGFRGSGYSPAFVEAMAAIQADLGLSNKAEPSMPDAFINSRRLRYIDSGVISDDRISDGFLI